MNNTINATNNITELTAFFNHDLADDIHLVVVKNMVLTKSHYDELFKLQMKLSGNKKIWTIIDTGSAKMITREAAIYAKEMGPCITWATALILKTDIARMVVAFFIKVIKPSVQTKIFANFDDAKEWVIEIKNGKN